MPRARTGVARHRKVKRIMKAAKGYVGGRRKLLRTAKETLRRAGQAAYIGRKHRKRFFRRLWITRISAALYSHEISYSKFMGGLVKANCEINRKMLSEMAIHDPAGFAGVVGVSREQVAG